MLETLPKPVYPFPNVPHPRAEEMSLSNYEIQHAKCYHNKFQLAIAA